MKKFTVKLVGQDGNAFAVLGAFKVAARRAGIESKQIDAMIEEATSGDYNHLLATVMKYADVE